MTQNAAQLPEIPQPPKSPLPVIFGSLGGLVVGAGVTLAAFSVGGGEPAPEGSASASASSAPVASASAESPKKKGTSLPERALAGDKAAIKELEKRPREERTAEESFAWDLVSGNLKREEIKSIAKKIKLSKLYARDKNTAAKLRELSEDRQIGMDVLRMLTEVEGAIGADLLYSVWIGSRKSTDATKLAEELLYTKTMRAKASKGLNVVLDMRAATDANDCEKMKGILEQAKEHGDNRSHRPMLRLFNKRGCGERKKDDCWKCFRDTDLLKDAIAAARNRKPT